MRRETRKLLEDVRAAIDAIEAYCADSTQERYLSDPMLRDAVERRFIIIGEALVRLRDEAHEVWEKIPAVRRVVAFRNRLVHGYDVIDDRVVWDVVRFDLPRLKDSVQSLLDPDTG